MKDYRIEFVKIEDLKPYEKNAKKHPAEQIERIANSIREFGWQQNIVIDKHNTVVIGHGRLLAAQKLGMASVPCLRVENLTQAQVRALRLADNRVAESEWDLDLLNLELDDLDLDMTDFGFDPLGDSEDDFESAEENEDDKWDGMRSHLQHNVFENQERMQFLSDNYYGIPNMYPSQTYGTQMLRFCDYKDVPDLSTYIAHFYYDDYKFIQAWKQPDKYLDRLKKFKAVISPNFSLYTDFPRALQILACYRKQWCGAYWQSLGLDVIPNVYWGDEKSYNYCFLGVPKGGVVSVSNVGTTNDQDWNGKAGDMFRAGYNEMLKRLEPTKILFYGTLLEGLDGDIIRIPSFYEERRKILDQRRDKYV